MHLRRFQCHKNRPKQGDLKKLAQPLHRDIHHSDQNPCHLLRLNLIVLRKRFAKSKKSCVVGSEL